MFRLDFRPRALKGLEKADRGTQLKINLVLDDLRARGAHKDVKKIQGTDHGYRLRVGRWRIYLLYLYLLTTLVTVICYSER